MEEFEATLRGAVEMESITGLSQANSLQFLITLLVSLCFGLILSAVYNIYFQDNEPQDSSLSRALVLLTPSLTSIFWMIQFSLSISIGLIGALAFVRFRTPVKRSEDVTFVVIALGIAIACATGHFLIAFTLVSVFLGFSFFRSKMHWLGLGVRKFAIVTFNTAKTSSVLEMQKILQDSVGRFDVVSSRSYDGITSFVINVRDLTDKRYDAMHGQLMAYDEKAQLSIFYPTERLGT